MDKTLDLEKTKKSEQTESTSFDMGTDLIESTATWVEPDQVPEAQKPARDQKADALEKAAILVSEGLLDEAKKTLRSLIIAQPDSVAARKKLSEIQEAELKKILS